MKALEEKCSFNYGLHTPRPANIILGVSAPARNASYPGVPQIPSSMRLPSDVLRGPSYAMSSPYEL